MSTQTTLLTNANRNLPENCGDYHASVIEIQTGPRGGKDVFCVICGKTYDYNDLPLDEQ